MVETTSLSLWRTAQLLFVLLGDLVCVSRPASFEPPSTRVGNGDTFLPGNMGHNATLACEAAAPTFQPGIPRAGLGV